MQASDFIFLSVQARSIEQKATEAELYAAQAQEESIALRKEVAQLHEGLDTAHKKVTEATERASAAEKVN